MKRFWAALALLLMIPALAMCEADGAQEPLNVGIEIAVRDEASLVRFFALAGDFKRELEEDARVAAVDALLDERFAQERSAAIFEQASARGWRFCQKGSRYIDQRVASIGLIWQGRQADGTDGCSAYGLTLDLATGEELTFGDLFADADAAAAAMEEIIERDIVWELSDYMEYADLLPMPRDCFWFDEDGFTVGYGDERYRYFSGKSGTVHFCWYELAPFIGEDSPLFALAQTEQPDAAAIAELAAAGRFGDEAFSEESGAAREGIDYERSCGFSLAVGDRMGDALDALTLLADPDYTRESMVYLFEDSGLRGYALEIPRYADTPEEDTPISAVRASRIGWHGLTTGASTREEIVALLGEPEETLDYGAQDAAYAMLAPGESLLYSFGENALEAHLDEDGVLSCLILRAAFPQRLY